MNDPNNPRYKKLKKIRDELLHFKESPLYTYRTENNYHPVVGEGSHYAKIMFIGEAPGETEAKQARPFCGAAGRVLDELLHSIGLSRETVYIPNLVKDRPPDNRDPLPAEVDLYAPFLDRQIEIIQPHCITTLGRHSMTYIMNTYGLADELKSISAIHGKTFSLRAFDTEMTYIPLYHPAVVLYSFTMKKVLMEDFQTLKLFL